MRKNGRYFNIFSPAAPIGTTGDGYYKVKRDQNFDFLYANVWKALKAGANIQQFILKFLVELLRCALP